MIIEKTVIEYLKTSLNIDVYAEFPENPPEEFLVVEKTGSSREEMLDFGTIAVQSYSKSLYLASNLNEKAKESMYNMVALPCVNSVKLSGDSNFTDLSMKRYRYQAVFEIVYY